MTQLLAIVSDLVIKQEACASGRDYELSQLILGEICLGGNNAHKLDCRFISRPPPIEQVKPKLIPVRLRLLSLDLGLLSLDTERDDRDGSGKDQRGSRLDHSGNRSCHLNRRDLGVRHEPTLPNHRRVLQRTQPISPYTIAIRKSSRRHQQRTSCRLRKCLKPR